MPQFEIVDIAGGYNRSRLARSQYERNEVLTSIELANEARRIQAGQRLQAAIRSTGITPEELGLRRGELDLRLGELDILQGQERLASAERMKAAMEKYGVSMEELTLLSEQLSLDSDRQKLEAGELDIAAAQSAIDPTTLAMQAGMLEESIGQLTDASIPDSLMGRLSKALPSSTFRRFMAGTSDENELLGTIQSSLASGDLSPAKRFAIARQIDSLRANVAGQISTRIETQEAAYDRALSWAKHRNEIRKTDISEFRARTSVIDKLFDRIRGGRGGDLKKRFGDAADLSKDADALLGGPIREAFDDSLTTLQKTGSLDDILPILQRQYGPNFDQEVINRAGPEVGGALQGYLRERARLISENTPYDERSPAEHAAVNAAVDSGISNARQLAATGATGAVIGNNTVLQPQAYARRVANFVDNIVVPAIGGDPSAIEEAKNPNTLTGIFFTLRIDPKNAETVIGTVGDSGEIRTLSEASEFDVSIDRRVTGASLYRDLVQKMQMVDQLSVEDATGLQNLLQSLPTLAADLNVRVPRTTPTPLSRFMATFGEEKFQERNLKALHSKYKLTPGSVTINPTNGRFSLTGEATARDARLIQALEEMVDDGTVLPRENRPSKWGVIDFGIGKKGLPDLKSVEERAGRGR